MTSFAGAAAPAFAASGHVTGTVFRDFNQNGVFDAVAGSDGLVDAGLVGVTATAYDASGAAVGSNVSTSAGGYDITVTGAHVDGDPLRIVFSGYPSGFAESFSGTDNGTSVQFAVVGDVGVDFALHALTDYSTGNLTPIVTLLQANGDYTGSFASSPAVRTATPAVSTHTALPNVATDLATFGEVGAVWGETVQSLGNGNYYLYASAVVKRHSGFGPQGIAGLYRLDLTVAPNGAVTRNAITSVDLSTALGAGSFGTVPRDLAAIGTPGGTLDAAAFPAVGETGIGGIAYGNGRLYVTNLADRTVYSYDVTNFAAPPVAIPLPTSAAERPWAVAINNGMLYVGLTDTTDPLVGARVISAPLASPSSFTTALNVPLDYQRGIAWNLDNPPAVTGSPQAQWHAWRDDDATSYSDSAIPFSNNFHAWAQPILSGIAFDEGGNMVLGLADRFGMQGGIANVWTDFPTDNTHQNATAIAVGDTLYAGRNGATYSLENNGQLAVTTASNDVVTRVASVGSPAPGQLARQNIQGPGGQEFFEDSVKYDGSGGIIPTEGVVHDETTEGAVLVIPGTGQVATTSVDSAEAYYGGGNRWMNLFDGESVEGFNQYFPFNGGYFAKSGGLGGVAALVADAPIQIGNRVWLDTNHDGIQGADEPAVTGVTVNLYDAAGTTLVATTTTDATGAYLFSSLTTPLAANSTYQVEFVIPSGGVTLAGVNSGSFPGLQGSSLVFTGPDVGGSDIVDSDVAPATGRVTIATGSLGDNNHSFDAGLALKTYAIGDRTWLDTDHDGVQDAGEPDLPGVLVTLLDASGTPVPGVSPVTTNANGLYLFDNLSAGDYRVSFSLPAGYPRSPVAGVGSTTANDSNADLTTGISGLITLDDTTVSTSYAAQAFAATQGVDPRWDAGFFLLPPPPTPAGLAFTGATLRWTLIGAGILLALVGAALLLYRARREVLRGRGPAA
ncbi:MAG: SdrD B-like domain-containing protein [Pseudolysinimonas sp.]